jgi:hypothetical protein
LRADAAGTAVPDRDGASRLLPARTPGAEPVRPDPLEGGVAASRPAGGLDTERALAAVLEELVDRGWIPEPAAPERPGGAWYELTLLRRSL